ncbi:MAG TPA: kinase [Sphingobium sp.]
MTALPDLSTLDRVASAIERWLAGAGATPLVVGLCGSQGSGKSTLAERLVDRLAVTGRRTAILSLDDLYLSGEARAALARDVHPLLRTRGVPLTHDVTLGLQLIADMRAGRAIRMPRFDKASDEPAPQDQWTIMAPPVDVILFEGWCVGARPQSDAALIHPVNALEVTQDQDGRWRRAVNSALGERYAALFATLDRLVLLAAPDFAVVQRWRLEQEDALRQRIVQDGGSMSGLMDGPAITHFIQHYERLTRSILSEMPARADLVVQLDANRQPITPSQ